MKTTWVIYDPEIEEFFPAITEAAAREFIKSFNKSKLYKITFEDGKLTALSVESALPPQSPPVYSEYPLE